MKRIKQRLSALEANAPTSEADAKLLAQFNTACENIESGLAPANELERMLHDIITGNCEISGKRDERLEQMTDLQLIKIVMGKTRLCGV